MRERAWYPPVFEKWFAGLLSQQVVKVLGKPVLLACVATEQNRVHIESYWYSGTLAGACRARVLPLFLQR